MKKLIILIFLFLGVSVMGQNKEEKLLDNVLKVNVNKTYQQYLDFFQKREKEYKNLIDKRKKRERKKGQLFPSIPSIKYTSEEYPLVILIQNIDKEKTHKSVSLPSKIPHFKNVINSVFKKDISMTAIYGSVAEYGVLTIFVE